MKIEENNDFLAQTGEIEKLKKERQKKTKTDKPADENTPELIVMNHDNITQELTKANITDQVLRELAEYKKLVVNGLEDKEGYEKVKSAQTLCRNTRVMAEKICKKGRESAIAEQRAWIKKEKEVSEQIEEVESYLKSQRDIIDKEKERQVAERENFMKTRMQERTTTLLGLGMTFTGEVFTMQEGEELLSINALDVKMSDDVGFNILSLKAEIIHEKSKIRIAAEQAAAIAERERVEAIAAQQKEEADRLAKQAAEIKAAQDALDKQRRDMEIAEEKRLAVAKAEADAKEKAEADKILALRVAEEEKAKALQEAENKRLADIAALKKQEEDRIAAEKKVAEEKLAAETAAKLKAEREAALAPEKQKLSTFAGVVAELHQHMPVLTTDPGKAAATEIKAAIDKLTEYVKQKANKL